MINAFRREGFASLIESLELVMMDVGARGGLDEDFLPAAWATTAVGFEPDSKEWQGLNGSRPNPWKGTRYLPAALGREAGSFALNVPRSAGGASLLRHNEAMVHMFGRPELHKVLERVNVDTITLDQAMGDLQLAHVDYLKLDVEGAELDVLSAGKKAVGTASAIKVECSFLEQRKGQPLIWEVADALNIEGYACVEVRDIHYWRRRPVPVHPYVARHMMPYSRGVAAQCDLIFLRDLQKTEAENLPRLFAVAAILGFFDYAVSAALGVQWLEDDLKRRCGLDWQRRLAGISKRVGRWQARRKFFEQARTLWPLFRSAALRGISPPDGMMKY